ncbi:aquaporin-3-like [Siniperca chuatsi]|uniref:aquaporin-3-like n=1 Tax=Siniperca chuatsi TaxID=119488 RepID=UPI001CE210B2|nr:aquaporin-3-like [Siniperca chuatsi]
MGKQKDILENLAGTFQIRQALADCLGTLILVMFGCGAVAQLVLSGGSHDMFLTVNFAFGFAATLGILVSRQVSGGHLNPAVTFTLCLIGTEPWRKFPLFFFKIYMSVTAAAQIIGKAALIMCILAIVDPHSNPIPRGLEPFTVGFVVVVIGLSMDLESGYAVRDLGPHIFTALAGWGSHSFSYKANTYWFFVSICAPFLGALVGTLMYQLMIGYHLEGEVQEKQKEEEKERFKLSNITTNEDA